MDAFIYDMRLVHEQSQKDLFKVVSLFAGAGGSSTGYKLAGGKVLAINEFLEEAQDTYQVNYPDTHIFKQDIRELTGDMILNQIGLKRGELDILDGSPPCASFSTAGKKEKMWGQVKKYSSTEQRVDDLFFEFARLLKEIQPKVFVAENVKGLTQGASSKLLGSEQMDIFGSSLNIYDELVSCGYMVRYKVLNSLNYGVPQRRERTIFIGIRNDIDKKISFPMGVNGREFVTLEKAFLGIENTNEDLDDANISNYKVYQHLLKMKVGSSFHNTRLLRKSSPLSHAFTLTASACTKGSRCEHHWDNRKFTIGELKRIMSFPDDYYLGKTYKEKVERLGRSVPPLMMKSVAEHIYNTILK
jgi:DNA (cytosine-5)-methyltransferase 1